MKAVAGAVVAVAVVGFAVSLWHNLGALIDRFEDD